MLGLLLSLLAPAATVQAQCPMCKASLESNLKNGGTAGKGINKGIFMMLFMPYVLVGSIGYVWWRNRKRNYDVEATVNPSDN